MAGDAKRTILHAAKTTLPVLFGYVPLGMAFGLLLADAGYGAGIGALMSAAMYAGSNQFLAIQLLRDHAPLIEMFAMALFLSARHVVYGLSLIERYRGAGRCRPYLIFALTDEVYGLMVGARPPEGGDERLWQFALSALCQSYWVLGSVLGGLLGAALSIDTKGMDFALTALFAVLAIDLLRGRGAVRPFAVGALCGALALAMPDRRLMMPLAIAAILLALIGLKKPIERGMEGGGGRE
ncbi:MAG: branched-chain amino acid ABC transporter permease [Clostridiales bacterium]|nr:branched-chain amino acid ABC transporter permease [Clostridiales bacterium]